ncbi:MAG TPA: acyl-CoA synthetase [Polyangiaceae bacterium]|jgi:long-chain acyl-CoA synthetase
MASYGFWKVAEDDPGHVALVTPAGESLTAGALLGECNRVVHGLRALGLRRGDTIAAMTTNEAATLEIYLAATQAGLYVTPINSHLAAPEVAYIVQDCDARAVFASERTADVCAQALDSVGLAKDARFCTARNASFRPYDALKAGQPTTLPADRTAGASMTYTSGTTGRPKGVRRPLVPVEPEAIAEPNALFLRLFGITPFDEGVHLVVSPLYHTAVLNFCTNHLHFGHTVVLMDKWTPEGMLDLVARHRVTTTHMVPTQFRRLLALPDDARARADVSSLRHVIHSAAPCPVDVKQRMLDWWGDVVYEYYAASEGGGTLATPQAWRAHPGTVGNAWPISKLRVVKDDGTDCAPREVGTVYMSMGAHKFEYHKDRDKTASTWKGDFFTVGDAGYLDEEGFLYLCDRKNDMIISGGVNIYPAEIESVLVVHPKVRDVAVFGIPDDDWGEHVKAVVELAPGVDGGSDVADELLAYCKERLAGFKCPRSIDFTAALPRDPNGKLYKRKLRDPYWAGRERAI